MRLATLLICVLLLPAQVFALTIGMTPSEVENNHLLPGSQATYSILLSEDKYEETTMESVITGNGAEFIEHPEEIAFKEGVNQVYAPLTIKIPEDTQPGSYDATIQYLVRGELVHLGLELKVRMKVVEEEFAQYRIQHIEAEHADNELNIVFTVFNQGNVPSGPEEISIEIRNVLGEDLIAREKQQMIAVAAFSEEEKTITFPSQLAPGAYWVEVVLDGIRTHTDRVYFESEGITGTPAAQVTGEAVSEPVTPQAPKKDRKALGWVALVSLIGGALLIHYKKSK